MNKKEKLKFINSYFNGDKKVLEYSTMMNKLISDAPTEKIIQVLGAKEANKLITIIEQLIAKGLMKVVIENGQEIRKITPQGIEFMKMKVKDILTPS